MRYNQAVRRANAILLLVVLTWIPGVAPWLAAASAEGESALPACCQRDGRHACAKRQAAAAAGEGFRAQPSPCAHYPAPAAAPAPVNPWASAETPVADSGRAVTADSALPASPHLRPCTRRSSANPERGPPASA